MQPRRPLMRNASGGTSTQSDGRNDDCRAIESDLVSLIERNQASVNLIEAVIARESSLGTSRSPPTLSCWTTSHLAAQRRMRHCSLAKRVPAQRFTFCGIPGREPARPENAAGRTPIQSGGMRLRTHVRILRRRGARSLLLVLALQKLDIDLGAVDANKFASPISQAGRR